MDTHITISLDCRPYVSRELDLRVPSDLTVKELLHMLADIYGPKLAIANPYMRNLLTGEILPSTRQLDAAKNGSLLRLEEI